MTFPTARPFNAPRLSRMKPMYTTLGAAQNTGFWRCQRITPASVGLRDRPFKRAIQTDHVANELSFRPQGLAIPKRAHVATCIPKYQIGEGDVWEFRSLNRRVFLNLNYQEKDNIASVAGTSAQRLESGMGNSASKNSGLPKVTKSLAVILRRFFTVA